MISRSVAHLLGEGKKTWKAIHSTDMPVHAYENYKYILTVFKTPKWKHMVRALRLPCFCFPGSLFSYSPLHNSTTNATGGLQVCFCCFLKDKTKGNTHKFLSTNYEVIKEIYKCKNYFWGLWMTTLKNKDYCLKVLNDKNLGCNVI